jgi:hypothetical protein
VRQSEEELSSFELAKDFPMLSHPLLRHHCLLKEEGEYPVLHIDAYLKGTYLISRVQIGMSKVDPSVTNPPQVNNNTVPPDDNTAEVDSKLRLLCSCIDLYKDVVLNIEGANFSGILSMEPEPLNNTVSDNSTKYSIMYTPTKSAVVTLFDDN